MQDAFNRQGFELVHAYHPVSGKNAADIQLIVDAMDLLANETSIHCFVLATGDSDFSPLFRRLRERGKEVVGCGPPSALQDAVMHHCTRFILADTLREALPAAPDSSPLPGVDERKTKARELLIRVLRTISEEVNSSLVGEKMRFIDPSFDVKNLGFSRLGEFLKSYPELMSFRLAELGGLYIRPKDNLGPVLEMEDSLLSAPVAQEVPKNSRELLVKAITPLRGTMLKNISAINDRMKGLYPAFDYKQEADSFTEFLKKHPDLVEILPAEGRIIPV
jgi:hypothetical protein